MPSEIKKKLVQQIIKDVKEYPIVGVVDLQNLPAPQLQVMRSLLLKKQIKIIMARKRLLQLALKEVKKDNLMQLSDKIKGMPALIFSKDNPFTLYGIIQKNKSDASAKAGQTAPRDIVVKAGPTSFAPGPVISELAAVGIKTKVEGGKLAIISDTTVVKEGEVISAKVAETLKRLDIKPMEIGLNVVAVWENGIIFLSKQLHIDEAEYAHNVAQAAQWAINLAVEAVYLTADTTETILQKAFREAKTLSVESSFITELTAGDILAKAEAEAVSVQESAGIEENSQ
ncbi:TPA: 50S ribosomal protein L10 [Candidatus Woesearchaeota archaeon]|nr:50S ribosomal protein L10 [Candidatus Woesearchaeota archaeon]HIH13472.1 50S ribosomal protein L10 [Candidatus Woesearchaeota archaeon]